MKKTLLLIFGALTISCNSDDNSSTIPEPSYHINEYFFNNMIYPNGVMENLDNLVKIEYDSNLNITQRKGGYSSFDPASGYPYIFTDNLYDQLTYSSNEILIEKKTTSSFSIPKFERKIFLEPNKHIIHYMTFDRWMNLPQQGFPPILFLLLSHKPPSRHWSPIQPAPQTKRPQRFPQ